jgi:hypothetical protein
VVNPKTGDQYQDDLETRNDPEIDTSRVPVIRRSTPPARPQSQLPVQRYPAPVAEPEEDEEEEPQHSMPSRKGRSVSSSKDRAIPFWFWIIVGMFVIVVLGAIGVRVWAWWMNTFHDPSAYTQTAHLDVAMVTDAQGHHYQARGFIDTKNHLDLMLFPDGDPAHSRLIVGPVITQVPNPQQAMVVMISAGTGTQMTIVAQGPYEVSGLFGVTPPSVQWGFDLSKGGN